MAYFEFPHTRTYDTDLGWLINAFNEIKEKLEQYLENAVITFADPITWDITEQYTALTCVIDSDGTAYLSKQPVPAGVDISNTNYWLPIFNYDDNINTLRSQIAYNAQTSATTGQALTTGDLVFWNGILYQVLVDMPAGTAFIDGTNVSPYTVDEKIDSVRNDIASVANDLAQEVTDRENAINSLMSDIAYNAEDSATTDRDLAEHDLVFWNGHLYEVIAPMTAGTAFVVGTNISQTTVDDKLAYILQNAGSIKYYQTMEDMVADFKAENIVCFVKEARAYLGADWDEVTNPDGAFFVYSSTMYSFETALDNGGCALLVTNPRHSVYNDPEATAANACYVAMSYCGVTRTPPFDIGGGQTATNVRYLGNNGPYFTETYYHNGIQCSQFTNCILYNMPYEMSKLASESCENQAGPGAVDVIRADNGDPLYLSANELAHYAALKGYLQETEYLEDAEVGDVLFWSEENSWGVDWKGITHCDFVIGKGDAFIQVVDAGLPPNDVAFNRNTLYPGYSNDAVAFVGIRTFKRTRPFAPGTYKLFGYARFPLHFPKRQIADTMKYGKLTHSYTAGQAQSQLPLLANSDNKQAKFGIWKAVGHSATKASKAGIMLTANTDASSYGTGGVVFNTDDETTTGGFIVLPFAVDGDAHPVRVSLYYRTGLSVLSDQEVWYKSNLDLYA